jgi:hypothetical protein
MSIYPFLQQNSIDPETLFNEILHDKAQFFQPRDANYMKYRGNEIKRTKAFVYDGDSHHIPIYLYPGFVYESVLHYATCEQYGGMMMQVKHIMENHLQQKINHIIITKYDQPDDCIGWHNDFVKPLLMNLSLLSFHLEHLADFNFVSHHLKRM